MQLGDIELNEFQINQMSLPMGIIINHVCTTTNTRLTNIITNKVVAPIYWL